MITKHDWHKHVTHVMKTYNISTHEGTEYTLNELVFERSVRVPTSILLNNKSNESYPEYMTALFKHYTLFKQ